MGSQEEGKELKILIIEDDLTIRSELKTLIFFGIKPVDGRRKENKIITIIKSS